MQQAHPQGAGTARAESRWLLAHGRSVPLDRPQVVAILNATPDSFYDGGALPDPAAAVGRARAAVAQGAAMLDVGGESTRPGARRVPAQEQLRRVLPVIEAIRASDDPALAGVPISVDTTLSAVARAAIQAGADAINDVSAGLEDPEVLEVAAQTGAGLVLMHRLAPPTEDRYADEYASNPHYAQGVVQAVHAHLRERLASALAAGVRPGSAVIDPGLGFGKSVEQNLQLLGSLQRFCDLGAAVYVGASRKRFVGRASIGPQSEPSQRLAGSIAATVLAAQGGALLHRVHDVEPHVQALRLLHAVAQHAPAGVVRSCPAVE